MIVGFSVAACSGVFAALASVFSKVALEDGGMLIRATMCPWIQEDYCDTVSITHSKKFCASEMKFAFAGCVTAASGVVGTDAGV